MPIITPLENLQAKSDRLVAIDTKLQDPTIIEATVIGKMNAAGDIKIVEEDSATTQYDSLVLKRNTLQNEVLLESSALSSLQNGYTQLKKNDISAVYGCRSLQNSTSSRSYTTELGTPNTSTFMYALLSSVIKVFKNSVGASLPHHQRTFKIDPRFIPNVKSDFINPPVGCDDVFLYSNADYAGQDFMIFAFKNTTGSSKTFAFDYNGSAYSTYSRTGVFQFTPSIDDAAIYAGTPFTLTGTSLVDTTSSQSTTDRTVNITLASGFSTIIVFYSAIRYITTNTAGRDFYIRNLKTNVEAQGLQQNTDIMAIFDRAIKGQKINNSVDFTQLNSLENVFKYRVGNIIPNYATNALALAGHEAGGNLYYNTTTSSVKTVLFAFANNAAALTGGLVAGDLYFNTTTSSETLVV